MISRPVWSTTLIFALVRSQRPKRLSHSTITMSNSLDQLKQTGTVVVSDSGDFECTCILPAFQDKIGWPCNFSAIDVYKPQVRPAVETSYHSLNNFNLGCHDKPLIDPCRRRQAQLCASHWRCYQACQREGWRSRCSGGLRSRQTRKSNK